MDSEVDIWDTRLSPGMMWGDTMVKTLRVLIHAEPETIWNVLLNSIEAPQHYMPDVGASSVVERLEEGTAKELNIG